MVKIMTENFGVAIPKRQRRLKRFVDLLVGSMLTLATLPMMVVIAVCIKLDTRGPVFFRQKRVGQGGKPFNMLKFRSMVVNAEQLQQQINLFDKDGNVIHKRPDDPRLTKIGRFIRKWSLDELPQFLNVLRGDMSLVGPRPELPWLVEQYEPWQYQRFSVPQGITGWWQINGRSERPMHLATEDDLYYIRHYSLWLDLKILLLTPITVLKGKGAF